MQELKAILEAGVAAGHAPGFSAAVITSDGVRHLAAAGIRQGGGPDAATPETLFWIASCSKAITSVAALQLVEKGLVDLDEPVGRRLPVLAAPEVLTGYDASGKPTTRPAKGPITLRQLLSHTSGLAYDFNCAELDQWLKATGSPLMGVMDPEIPLMFDPGEKWLYGIGIDWAGRLIETVTGQTLDAYVAENILGPLGMTDTTYFPDAAQAGRVAPVHAKLPDGGWATVPFGMPSGHHFMMGGGGLYATANDYAKFLGAILAGGVPLLKPETCALMMSNQVGDLDAGGIKSAQPMTSLDFEPLPGLRRRHGLAGMINLDAVPGGRSAGSLAWAGLANCYYWADPKAGIAGVVMAQLFPFADPGVLSVFEAVEKAAYR